MTVTIIYDNVAYTEGLRADWGFSCLVETDNVRILFDTGANGATLLYNMEKLNIYPSSIDKVFISHAHRDHTGGLNDFLEVNKRARVYLPSSIAKTYGLDRVVSVAGPIQIHEGVFSTGELKGIEQSLVVNTAKGLAVIAGCSHPGVSAILTAASRWGKAYALIGGLHGFREFELLRDLGLVCACHCTQFRSGIEKFCNEKYNSGGAGRTLQL
ncbi:MAG: MBL fold metallo-hydrolase [Dehalococcoidia bacterium]|nr:MAG: MBL fold metallo-hydrolase [Dehalococcoidia bacterium]